MQLTTDEELICKTLSNKATGIYQKVTAAQENIKNEILTVHLDEQHLTHLPQPSGRVTLLDGCRCALRLQ